MATPSQTSSSTAAPSMDISSNNAGELNSVCTDVVGEHDLLIVGPGVLGRIVAEKWQQEYPNSQIYGQTMTTNHHDELIKLGIKPFLRDTKFSHKFPYDFPLVPIGRSSRTDVLLKAENAALEGGGCVLRLVGLYNSDKGPHKYWLEKGTVETRPDHILNLIHYEDAASLSIAILKKNLRNRVFVGCDNHPLSRQDIMDAVSQSGKFDKNFNGFTGTDDPLGKKIYNTKTRAELVWEPKYQSFRQFLGLTD